MHKPNEIVLKRAYDPVGTDDGYRALVDGLWPRGCSKASLKLDEWAKLLAPTQATRKAYGHDPPLWETFRHDYGRELAQSAQQERMRALLTAAAGRRLTLVYAAHDGLHSNAEVLHEALLRMVKSS
ncbi:DUF488 domain-containing protein [Bordetella holmesii]|uniref:PF04343 family protein n=2 Tax=Bordetella holmesii TaxID=35814 RepID=A0A158M5A4_9BORD|nr:DUF488 family protein [Bordetella holmesii]AHV93660.1 hypothetical protein D560_3585 [Bordetella holmesii ATCC 51541]AIT28199.1 hypothetical protein D558_3559 [Bordetella holmesii 44057]EWM40984.1 hypothetical protein D555_3629 [Bordetella holmesii 35009]EWM42575.1 hypothetical protein D556_3555 [Bordetella holmesii 41130]EWM44876.1 hypothetical protein D557_2865 [Bordetella holmesii 70147]